MEELLGSKFFGNNGVDGGRVVPPHEPPIMLEEEKKVYFVAENAGSENCFTDSPQLPSIWRDF